MVESFRFHPTLILLYLKECQFLINFNSYICNTFCTALYSVFITRCIFILYTFDCFTFYVNTICLIPNSLFIFVLGRR